MTLLILGATGRTGRFLLQESLDRAYRVHAIVRDKNKLPGNSGNLVVFEGSPEDESLLEKAAQGCNAILSTLNVSRTSDFPWAALRSPADLMSKVMAAAIRVARKNGIKRIVVCSAWGTFETKKKMPVWFRWLVDNSKIGLTYKDHERQESLLMASGLDWTIVRPTGLTNSLKPAEIQVALDEKTPLRLMISRQQVARFMLDTLKS